MAPRKGSSKDQALAVKEPPKLPTKGDTSVPEHHPQRLHLLSKDKAPISLQAWFDGGLIRPTRPAFGDDEEADKREDERHLTGALQLPGGYSGMTVDQYLAIAVQPGIHVWPVRFDLGDQGVDGEEAWTLYHYTNRDGFGDIVRAFLETQVQTAKEEQMHFAHEAHEKAEVVTKALLKELNDEYEDRNSKPSPLNPRGDPEMLLVEPGKFSTTAEAIKAMYGFNGLTRRTRDGVTFELMADYVVAFRVSGTACYPLPASAEGALGMVRVCRDTLDLLRRRGEQKRENLRVAAKLERIKKAQHARHHHHHHHFGNLFGCFGGGGKAPDLDEEEAEQTQARRDIQAKHGDECVVRDKRELDQAQEISMKFWARGHYENVQKKVEAEEKKKSEELKKREAKNAKKRARQEAMEKAQEYRNAVVMNRGARAYHRSSKGEAEKGLDYYIKKVIGEKTFNRVVELTSRRKKEMGQVLYDHWLEREEASKECTKPALARIKLGKESAEAYFAERKANEDSGSEESYVPE